MIKKRQKKEEWRTQEEIKGNQAYQQETKEEKKLGRGNKERKNSFKHWSARLN